MKHSTSFTTEEIDILKNMIGKEFNKYMCDPFIYSPTVYGIVVLYVDGQPFKLTSLFETKNRFFNPDDVSIFRIKQINDDDIKSFSDDCDFIKNPISSKIISIDVITDHQSVNHDGKTQIIDYSVGLIFHLDDSREISFEIKTWFSEMITIEKGYNLIEKFTPIEDFYDEWENCEGYTASCTREILVIN